MKRVRSLGWLMALVGTALLGACESTSSSGSDTSRLSIKLTDAPAELAEAWVEIRSIYLQGSSDEGGSRVYLREGSTGLVDLLTLSGGTTADLVADVPVPAGTYSQLRFVIGDAYVRTRDGRVYATSGAKLPVGVNATGTLQCPSCAQSGLKVTLPGGSLRLDEGSTVVVVDFDASQSFGHQAGNSGKWVMHPVLHATRFESSAGIHGRVGLAAGVELPTCGGAPVALTQLVPTATSGEVTKSGSVASDGTYRIDFVAPGTYTMGMAPIGFENADSLFVVTTPGPLTVSSGTNATFDYQVTAATCKPKA